ncbi:hypothetical protein [Geodermatophilus dictyosporus]|uniref:hypothetical protein n=1 Tax=Geodermatophilus dictyosporus TaxID=1523247 RepID=UPI00145C2F35|nr:hypothetical protein [Geodermatophilus dictyosporus]
MLRGAGAGTGIVAEGDGTVVGATRSAGGVGAAELAGADVAVADALEPAAAGVFPVSSFGDTAAPSTASASTPAGMA